MRCSSCQKKEENISNPSKSGQNNSSTPLWKIIGEIIIIALIIIFLIMVTWLIISNIRKNK